MILKYKSMLSLTVVCFSCIWLHGCAESNSTNNLLPASNDNDVTTAPDAAQIDAIVDSRSDLSTSRDSEVADLYIPPPPADMYTDMAEPVELTLRRCVQRMLDYLDITRQLAGCDDTPIPERSNPSSPYAREPIAAACIKLECSGLALDGHNGIPTTRSCKGIDNLMATLEVAEEDANANVCGTPVFQVKVIALDNFAGPEACDALICGLEADGNVIAIDQRN